MSAPGGFGRSHPGLDQFRLRPAGGPWGVVASKDGSLSAPEL